jgi:antitoxin ChpS
MAHKARLRRIGGSVVLTIPPALLDALDLDAGAGLWLSVKAGRLVVEPINRQGYALDELLSRCRPGRRRPSEDRAWTSDSPAGRELI